jgi:CubicO group peptidase (beta-lactamase class C family)
MLMTHLTPLRARRNRRWPAGFALALAAGLCAVTVLARPAQVAPATDRSTPDLNAAAVSAFADAVVPAALRERKIPGAVLVVVQDDQVLCEKAFGVADLQTQKPVSTGRTLFRVASISKILTAASALQLVDAGKLDLHRDVNDYLARFRIASTFARPVTLFNLLTHSSGFDENEFGYASRSATNRLSLRDYLITHQPARVRPPGWFSVYDNYGFALAGYLVQRASGLPFGDYVRREIFEPLDMDHSSFSPAGKLRQHLATGYWLDHGEPRACGPNYVNITPAAGLCTTASDMADFLVALLTNRRPDGAKFLPDDVIRGLQTQQFAASPEVPGRCYGFDRVLISGRSALRQPGQWLGFNSVLMLFPRQHCGLFLAYNLCDYEHLDRLVTRWFAERFIPPDTGQRRPPAESATDKTAALSVVALTGCYLSTRATYEAPELNFPRQIRLSRSPDGKLIINGLPYREIKPAVFEKIGTNDAAVFIGRRVAFLPGPDGEMQLVTQTAVFRRVPWVESPAGQSLLMRTVTTVFVSAAVLWLIMGMMQLALAGAPENAAPAIAPAPAKLGVAARGIALATCLLALWFEAAFALAEWKLKPFANFFGFPATLQSLMWALPVLLALTVALAVCTVLVWHRRLWHPLHRLHFTLVTVAGAVLLYIFYARHLLFVG